MRILTGLIMLSCLVLQAGAYPFEEAPPVIYKPTEMHVENGINLTRYEMTLVNPCEGIPTDATQPLANKDATKREIMGYRYLYAKCTEYFVKEVIGRMNELAKVEPEFGSKLVIPRTRRHAHPPIVQTELTLSRKKRVAPLIIAGAGIMASSGIVAVSNGIDTIIERYNPNSAQNRINNLTEQFQEQLRRLDAFNKNFNITKYVLERVTDDVAKILRMASELDDKIESLKAEMPLVVWFFMDARLHIYSSAEKLDRIIKAFRRGRLATFEVGQMFKDERIISLKEEHVKLTRVSIMGSQTFSMDVAITEIATDTSIFEIEAFDHWTELTTQPTRIHYEGARYLVFNETANCAKAIANPKPTNDERCDDENYMDWHLKKWSRLVRNPLDTVGLYGPHVLKTAHYNFVECFQHTIIIGNKNHSCPSYTFKLKSDISFKIGNFSHTPNFKKIQLMQGGPAPIEAVMSRHLEGAQKSADEVVILRDLWHLKSELAKITVEPNATKQIMEVLSGWSYQLYVGGLAIIGIVLIVLWYRNQPTTTNAPSAPGTNAPHPTYVTINNTETLDVPRARWYPDALQRESFEEGY